MDMKKFLSKKVNAILDTDRNDKYSYEVEYFIQLRI